MKIAIVAGEASGDSHGAALMEELQKKIPNVIFLGLGGPKMGSTATKREASGYIENWITESAVLGLWDVLKKYGYFHKKFSSLLKQLEQEKPEAIILIDYAGFNLRLARAIRRRKLPIKIIKYISPQVWAWNRRRIPEMARNLDLMICIFPFEEKIYKDSGLPTVFSGHPLVEKLMALQNKPERLKKSQSGCSTRDKNTTGQEIAEWTTVRQPKGLSREGASEFNHRSAASINTRGGEHQNDGVMHGYGFFENALKREKNLLGLFPGSRSREVHHIFPAIAAAAKRVMEQNPSIRCEVAAATTAHACQMETIISKMDNLAITITVGQATTLMQRAAFGLVCSGTATLEAAALGLPYALVYKATPLTAMVARRLIKVPYLGIINILAGHLVVKEFLQEAATPQALAQEALYFLENHQAAQELSKNVTAVAATLRSEGAYERAAEAIFNRLKPEDIDN